MIRRAVICSIFGVGYCMSIKVFNIGSVTEFGVLTPRNMDIVLGYLS